jgi:hypothetical protein
MTDPPQPCTSDYDRESGLFKKVIKFLVKPAPPLVSVLNRAIDSSQNFPFEHIHHFLICSGQYPALFPIQYYRAHRLI